jgi:hypothetical protein
MKERTKEISAWMNVMMVYFLWCYIILIYWWWGYIPDPIDSSRCVLLGNCSVVTPDNGKCSDPCYFEWLLLLLFVTSIIFFLGINVCIDVKQVILQMSKIIVVLFLIVFLFLWIMNLNALFLVYPFLLLFNFFLGFAQWSFKNCVSSCSPPCFIKKEIFLFIKHANLM